MKKQPTELGKTFTKKATDKRLVSIIYKEVMHLSIRKREQNLDRRPKYTFLQIRHTKGQEDRVKMLNVTNH